jgi:hypothetical protein
MITISNRDGGYKVLFSPGVRGWRGFSLQAQDIPEVHQMIDHYYGKPHDKSTCQICARTRKEAAKLAKKGEDE